MQKQREAKKASGQLTTAVLTQALFHMMLPNASTCPPDYVALVSISACCLHDHILCMLLQSPLVHVTSRQYAHLPAADCSGYHHNTCALWADQHVAISLQTKAAYPFGRKWCNRNIFSLRDNHTQGNGGGAKVGSLLQSHCGTAVLSPEWSYCGRPLWWGIAADCLCCQLL